MPRTWKVLYNTRCTLGLERAVAAFGNRALPNPTAAFPARRRRPGNVTSGPGLRYSNGPVTSMYYTCMYSTSVSPDGRLRYSLALCAVQEMPTECSLLSCQAGGHDIIS